MKKLKGKLVALTGFKVIVNIQCLFAYLGCLNQYYGRWQFNSKTFTGVVDKKNFVDGDPNCNYEKYLVEFLNNSAWFRNKVKNELFVWREKQDHGECDTFAGGYELDLSCLLVPLIVRRDANCQQA